METLKLSLNQRYSYADYLTWFDEKRRELIDGFIKMMSPAPAKTHQQILGSIYSNFWFFLKNNPCQVFPAPFDVRLPKDKSDKDHHKIFTVVQPDITVVCDLSKLDEKGCLGAPDLIVEIISPFSAKRDLHDKFEIYEQSGVKEYWVVFPADKAITIFDLNENGKYNEGTTFKSDLKVKSELFPEFEIEMQDIFK